MSQYADVVKCTKCGEKRLIFRRSSSAGKMVRNHCPNCGKHFVAKAGEVLK